jgi:hypothetical protein
MEQPVVFTVVEFCAAHRISRSLLYLEWKAGTGPRFLRVGTRILITREAAAQWRMERERNTAESAAAGFAVSAQTPAT